MNNLLTAFCHIVEAQSYNAKSNRLSENRINSVGNSLEDYVIDAFCDALNISDENERITRRSKIFSWLGSQNNPPDAMLRDGDAIEVKKITGLKSTIALNSSFPKNKLNNDDPMLTMNCRQCENWQEKDLIYAIGSIPEKNKPIRAIWFIYGSIYAADASVYQKIKSAISMGVNQIENVVFSDTKELGRVNEVDPLKITSLRIRGMWQIKHPAEVFSYAHTVSNDSKFDLIAIIPKSKFDTFDAKSRNRLNSLSQKIRFSTEHIKNPNNPAELIECVVLKFIVNN